MRLIDLSLQLEPSPSEPEPVTLDYISHAAGAEILGRPLGIGRAAFPEQMAISLERIALTSHSGTHLDAPLHYGPLCAGQPAKAIADIPLSWCMRPGVILDCSHGPAHLPISLEEVQRELARQKRTLYPLDIVLLYTGADRLWGTQEYLTEYRGVSLEATQWLVELGIKIIGVDSFGFDPPFHRMLKDYASSHNENCLWPCHIWGRQREYCQIEKLTNLAALPQDEPFWICCFPIKIKHSGAGWTRVVAVVNSMATPMHIIERSVDINAPLEAVAQFTSQVTNLPLWTRFFVRVAGRQEWGYHVETLLGPAITAINAKEQRYTITSQFADKIENAQFCLNSPNAHTTAISFTLHLPANCTEERRHQMTDNLERELIALKSILES